MQTVTKGEMYFVDFGRPRGSEQGGYRPVVIVQTDIANATSPTTIVVPMTSRSKPNLPSHVVIDHEGLLMPSVVLAEQIQTVDKTRLTNYLGKLNEEQIRAIDNAIAITLNIDTDINTKGIIMGNIQFTSKGHEARFKKYKKAFSRNNKRMNAAIYLLTADYKVWKQCRDHIERDDIDFESIHPQDFSTHGYSYYQAAKDILRNTGGITIDDMLDKSILDNKTLKTIITGLSFVRTYPFGRCISNRKGVGDEI